MPDPSLPFTSLADLAGQIARGLVSPVEVVEAMIARIERLNPALNAYLALLPGLRRQARAAERAVARKRTLGPLHGVPISVKDLILTRSAPTTAGSRVFGAGLDPGRDAAVVARLRRAGAIVLGKTNLHELAYGVTSENEHFGPVRNPWDPSRVAGGSSGGSGAAVAAGLCYGSVGTDTRGSIRIPAACCGITGLKPSYGLVPTAGVVPLSATLDHVGPMTRSVEDAGLMLAAMGRSRRLARRLTDPGPGRPSGWRIGLSTYHLHDLDPEVERVIAEALDTLRRLGATLTEVTIPELGEAHAASTVIAASEAVALHDRSLREQPEAIGPRVRARLQGGYAWTAVDYVRAEQTRALVTEAFARAFQTVDYLVGATVAALPPRVGEERVRIGERDASTVESFTRFNSPQNMAGVPALSIPCGLSRSGLPVGLQLVAARGRDDRLLAIGAWIQRETGWHRGRPPPDGGG